MRIRVLTIAIAALSPLAAASAQIEAAPRNVLSFQPLSAMLTVYSAEYERQTASAVSVGVGGTYWNIGEGSDDLTYKSGDVKLRYYPQGVALRGFAFGGSVGFTTVTGTSDTGTEETASGASFGLMLEYQWLMGATRNFALALGVGAKALSVKEETFSSGDFTARYPTARISVGYAF
jgi:hypothetical protein